MTICLGRMRSKISQSGAYLLVGWIAQPVQEGFSRWWRATSMDLSGEDRVGFSRERGLVQRVFQRNMDRDSCGLLSGSNL